MEMLPSESLASWCNKTVELYMNLFPDETSRLASLKELLAMNVRLDDRRTLPGHVTGSAIILDLHQQRILLIHHKSLNRWLQPGGHVEPGELPPGGARREMREEVGIEEATLLSPLPTYQMPIDIDSHPIPGNPNKEEPEHTHHDFRFLFAVDSTKPLALLLDEVVSSEWMPFDDARLPESVQAAIDKALAVTTLYPIPIDQIF